MNNSNTPGLAVLRIVTLVANGATAEDAIAYVFACTKLDLAAYGLDRNDLNGAVVRGVAALNRHVSTI